MLDELCANVKDRRDNPSKYAWEVEAIGQMNKYTEDDVVRILASAGIRRGSESWEDYERAKRVVVCGLWIDGAQYDRIIEYIADYLGL
jgi:hypothetical protein